MSDLVVQPKSVSPSPIKIIETVGDMALLNNGQVLIDGYAVPKLLIGKGKDEAGQEVFHISLDERFGYFASDLSQLYTLVSLVANAMAISRGYSSFGNHCRPTDEFNVLPLGYRWETKAD